MMLIKWINSVIVTFDYVKLLTIDLQWKRAQITPIFLEKI